MDELVFNHIFETKNSNDEKWYFQFGNRNESKKECNVVRWNEKRTSLKNYSNVSYKHIDEIITFCAWEEMTDDKPYTWMIEVKDNKLILNVCGCGGSWPFELKKVDILDFKF